MESCTALEDARKRLANSLRKVVGVKGDRQYMKDSEFCRRLEIDPQYDDCHVAVFNGEVIGKNPKVGFVVDEIWGKYPENAAVMINFSFIAFIYTKNPIPEITKQRKERHAADEALLDGLASDEKYRDKWVAVKNGEVVIVDEQPFDFFSRLIKMCGDKGPSYIAFRQFYS